LTSIRKEIPGLPLDDDVVVDVSRGAISLTKLALAISTIGSD
jgi:hypothetical protein